MVKKFRVKYSQKCSEKRKSRNFEIFENVRTGVRVYDKILILEKLVQSELHQILCDNWRDKFAGQNWSIL